MKLEFQALQDLASICQSQDRKVGKLNLFDWQGPEKVVLIDEEQSIYEYDL